MQAVSSEETSIQFGEFALDLKNGELLRGGSAVKLQPQPFKVLVALAARAGEVVTREELQQQVWEGETFVDFEHGLNFCIKQIRAALGDNAQAPRYIETIPRRGYRFIAPVEKPVDKPDSVAQPEFQKPYASTLPRLLVSSRLVVGVGVVLIATLAVATYFFWWRPSPAPNKKKIMLAVLPFENLSADPEQDYFSDGLTEEMITQLGRLQPERLGVIARTSTIIYKAAGKDIRRIGSELGVDYVLEGSVRREGDRVRITAQLIQVSDQTHLWAETYDRSRAGALTIQSEVAALLARSLALELLPSETSEPARGTDNPEAHDLYLKGRYLWGRGAAGDLEKSVDYFKRAIEKDPGYALAYAGLADCYRLIGMSHLRPPREVLPKARDAALKALELDGRLAEAHTALGSVRFWLEWDWTEAEREFKRAIEINPSYGLAHHDYAWFLVCMERMDEGLSEIKRAQELDPLSPRANSDVGWVYLRARRYDEAIRQIKRTLELEPDFASAHGCLEQAYLKKDMYIEAAAAARKLMAGSGASADELAAVDSAEPAEAMKIVTRWRLDRADRASKTRSVSPYLYATRYAALGERDRAFEWLEKAFEDRDTSIVSLKVDPACDNLRSDPRFPSLLRRIGFP
jgi:TolB-like protein/DNA-binding winged helix-turn-helix (wHTH) protein